MSKKTLQIMGASFLGAAAAIGLGAYVYRLYQRKMFDKALHESEDWEDDEDEESFEDDDDDDIFLAGADSEYCDKVRECLEKIASSYIWGSRTNMVCAFSEDFKERIHNIEVEPFAKVYDPDHAHPEKVAEAIAEKRLPKEPASKAESIAKKADEMMANRADAIFKSKNDEGSDYWTQYTQKVTEALKEHLKPDLKITCDEDSHFVKITDKTGKQLADVSAEVAVVNYPPPKGNGLVGQPASPVD